MLKHPSGYRQWLDITCIDTTSPDEHPKPPYHVPSQTHNAQERRRRLAHLVDELRDGLLSVSGITALDVADELSGPPAAVGGGELEGPEEGGGLLEVGSAGGELVDEVLHAWKGRGDGKRLANWPNMTKGARGRRTDDTLLAELLLDDRVVGNGDSLTVDLGVSSLVNELLDGLQVGFTKGKERIEEEEGIRGSVRRMQFDWNCKDGNEDGNRSPAKM